MAKTIFFVDPTNPIAATLLISTPNCIACGDKPRVKNGCCADCLPDFELSQVLDIPAGGVDRFLELSR